MSIGVPYAFRDMEGLKYRPDDCVFLPNEIIKTTKKLDYSTCEPPYYYEVIKRINDVILCYRVRRNGKTWERLFPETIMCVEWLLHEFKRVEQ